MTALPDAIDAAWGELLKRLSETDANNGRPIIEYKDQIDALEAAAKWIEVKSKLPTPIETKKESKFDAIKSDFHGRPRRQSPNPWGRNGKPSVSAEPPPGGNGVAGETAEVIAFNGTGSAAETGPGDGVA